MNITLPRRVYNIRLQQGDFPIAMHVSDRHKLLTIISSRGSAVLMDVFTGAILSEEQFTPAIVFCGADDNKHGGVVCVNNQGTVIRVAPNDQTIINFVKSQMHNP